MRRIAILICLSAGISFLGVAAASTRLINDQGVGKVVFRLEQPYPAIRLWLGAYEPITVECLLNLVLRYNRKAGPDEALTIVDAILSSSFVQEIDPLLVASVIAAESSFRRYARSHCGAQGLMQLTGPVQPWLGVSDPYDIRQNISGGCLYLKNLQRRFGRTDLVLAAYNAGPGRVAAARGIPAIRETVCYVHRVMTLQKNLRAEVEREGRVRGSIIAGLNADRPFVLV